MCRLFLLRLLPQQRTSGGGDSSSSRPWRSDLNSLRDRKRIVDIDSEVAHGTLDFGMTWQELNSPEIARSSEDIIEALVRRRECVP
jgi:hypothetical protein